jgi:Concanavalin A-like lectin/glucanases superfamily/Bacterial Ig-like domain (group 2)
MTAKTTRFPGPGAGSAGFIFATTKLRYLPYLALPYLALVCLMLGLAGSASAQDDHWNGTVTNTLWNNPANWSLGIVPPPGNPITTFTGNVWLDAANGDNIITIPPDDNESPGIGNTNEVFNTIFGPEFGCTLNVYGTLTFDWLLFPVQNNANFAGPRSYVNLFSNALVSTSGAALGIGDSWFYTDAPFETMNLYGNSQYKSLGGAGLWLGGHLNIYDNASFYVNGYVNMDNAHAQSDGTRAIIIGGGQLTLPENSINGGNSGSVASWITRGILRAYGKGYDTNDLVITDDGTNTHVTVIPLGGTLQRVYFQPLPLTNLEVRSYEQATLVGDYPSVSGVLLSSSEPGLSPTSFPHPLYTSSNPNIVAVDTNGVLTAVGTGTATITATVGAFNSTNSLVVTVQSLPPTLLHEYSFSEANGSTTVADSVPGNSPTWDGAVQGGATLGGGQITFDGSTGYVQLPAGIMVGMNEVTVEAWASFGSPINTWANLFAFGDTDGGGAGLNYLTLQPHTGGTTIAANFGQGDPGSAGERDAVVGTTLDGRTNVHIVVVFQPSAGSTFIYTNGVLASSVNTIYNNLVDPVAYAGPTYNSNSIIAYTVTPNFENFIGHSLYTADPTLNGSVDEFRIYGGVLSTARVRADTALGPNQMIGTNLNTSMSVSASGGNLIIKWPTSSALVNLVASPTLGASAVWTPVVPTQLIVVGANYQATIPTSGSGRFIRLQQ